MIINKIRRGYHMTSELLLNTRKINKTLQSNAGTSVSFDQLSVDRKSVV